MRFTKPMFATVVTLSLMSTAHATEPLKIFAADGYDIAQRADTQDPRDARDQEERDREQERRDREQERRDRAAARRERAEARHDRSEDVIPQARFWIGVGAGAGLASIKTQCSGDPQHTYNCDQGGDLGTYSANVTITGPYSALRLRGIRQTDDGGNQHVPYEEAALVGSRFGHSNWYGLAGVSRLQHIDDKHPDDSHGFAWEILFAPSSMAATGLELSFQGDLGEAVDFFGVNVGMRFGQLR